MDKFIKFQAHIFLLIQFANEQLETSQSSESKAYWTSQVKAYETCLIAAREYLVVKKY